MVTSGGNPPGRRLLPAVLDELAATNPTRLYGAIPKTSDLRDGFRDITVADLARCVNFMAKWIEDRFGRSDTFETITYVGITDFRGTIVFIAAVKCGYKVLLPSARNPPSTNLSLMSQTGSTKILHATEIAPLVQALQAIVPSIRSEAVPSFAEMITSNPDHYPYEKSFDEAINDPVCVLHSSGSTGVPKPITITHGAIATYDNETNLPAPPGRQKRDASMWQFEGEARVYIAFPFFHAGGFMYHIANPIFRNMSLVLGPPHILPDGLLLKEISQHQKLRALWVMPSILEQVLQEPNGIELFKSLDFIAYAGAPLPPHVGDRLAKLVPIYSPFGCTETFSLPELDNAPEEWVYHEFNPYFQHEMQVYDATEGTFELVILTDDSARLTSAVYHTLPGVKPFYTRDLFTQHPQKPSLFRYYGRRDDIIVLLNGEKFNPVPLEQRLQGHPSLKGVLVTGNGRTQPVLLLELKETLDEEARSALEKQLWPLIEESNAYVSGQGRIARNKVLCALPDKPFTRTGKGTVVRKLTEETYKNEIEMLYSDSSSEGKTVSVSLQPTIKTIYEPANVIAFLRQVFATSFVHGANIGEDEDFFAYGLDSVQTIEITASLKRSLQDQTPKSVAWITARTIFRNSTFTDLARLLVAFLNEGAVPKADSALDRARIVDETVARYVDGLPKRLASQTAAPDQTSTVAIIGSTGYLGSYIVAALLKNPDISRVYCLNRGSDAQEKQRASLSSLDKTLEPLLQKLVYMKVELGQPLFGLSQDKYDLIATEVDVMVYNSWRLDFGLAIQSFDPFLRATRDVIDLASASKRNMRVVFVSSMSSIQNMAIKATAPEGPVEDPMAASNMGYGQSKQAAERILTAASRESGVPVSIVRVCQVGGPSQAAPGVWADQPWISAIVRTAKTLGSIPSHVAPIDWVPVDTVAAMLHAFIVRPATPDAQFFNIYHDDPQPWLLFIDILRESLGITRLVSLGDWVTELQKIRDPSSQDVARLPALKMLDFYEAFGDGCESLTIATDHARSISNVEIPVLDKELLETWLRSWNI